MKILLVNKFFYLKGGAEKYFFNLIELLKKEGHQIAVFSMKDKKNFPSPFERFFIKKIDFQKKENIFREGKKFFHLLYSFEARQKFEKLLKEFQPEIIHFHNFAHQLTPSILPLAKKSGAKTVMTLHDYKLICPNYRLFTQGKICERCRVHKYYQALFHRCMKSYLKSLAVCLEMILHKIVLRSYRFIDYFFCPSLFIRDKCLDWGIEKKKLVYLPHFLDPQDEPSFNFRNYILYFGRISQEKGIRNLIEVVGNLKGVNLRIVGKGKEKEKLQKIVFERKYLNIEFLGYKTQRELKELIRGARFVILPSLWYENAPLAVLESYAQGRAVLASRLGGLKEIVLDDQTGYLFQPNDLKEIQEKISSLYFNLEKLERLGKGAFSFLKENFSSGKHLEKLLIFYQE